MTWWCFWSLVTERSSMLSPTLMLALCLYWQSARPRQVLMLGVCVVRWSRLGPTVLCDQSDQMESPPLLSPGYRLSGCQEHNYELPVNWCVMEFNISPDMMTNTSKWKISFSGPSALIIDWRVPFLSRKWFGGRWPIIIQSFDHLAV